jgi:hypothetical protein
LRFTVNEDVVRSIRTEGAKLKKGKAMSNTFRTSNDPMKHKTGKPRLGPLTVEQLTKLLESARPKHRAKIQRALDYKKTIQKIITTS